MTSRNTSRRNVLRLIGGGAIALTAGAAGWAYTRTPTHALAPWRPDAHTHDDPRLRSLAYAILAPNPHNRQPWLIDLDTPGAITIYADLDRLLPETDPLSRQITIGFGCFLETLRIAAAEDGWRAEIDPFPEGEDAARLDQRPVARIQFERGAEPDPLFAQILRRHTNRVAYEASRTPNANAQAALIAAGAAPNVTTQIVADPDHAAAIGDLAFRGHVVEAMTEAAHLETVRLVRIGRAEIEANPDGVSLGGAFLEMLSLLGVLTRESLADPNSMAFRQGIEMFDPIYRGTPAFLSVTSASNTRADQLAAGGAWVRAHLHATALGLAMQPVSQTLQEYPEMAELYAEARALLDIADGETPANARPARLRAGGERKSALVVGDAPCYQRLMTDRPTPTDKLQTTPQAAPPDVAQITRFLTEIGIIDQLLSTILDRALPDGVTRAQFALLNHLTRLGGRWTPQRLAAALQVTKGAITNTTQKLAARGAIAITADPGDGRSKFVELTDAGLALRGVCIEALTPHLGSLAQALTANELEAAMPALTAARKHLDEAR